MTFRLTNIIYILYSVHGISKCDKTKIKKNNKNENNKKSLILISYERNIQIRKKTWTTSNHNSKTQRPRHRGERKRPSLDVLDTAQEINMTGRILFNHVLDIVRFESFLKLPPSHEVLQLQAILHLHSLELEELSKNINSGTNLNIGNP